MRKFWDSSVGKKVVMGLSGLVGIGFLIVHMLGNLQAFMGAERFNAYSHLLKVQLIEVTWAVRAGLLVAVVVHVIAAYQLTMRNRAARPEAYAKRVPQVSTYASQTMRYGGVYLLLFIVYHIGHFTTGTFHPAFSEAGAFGNVMIGFSTWPIALFYLGAMGPHYRNFVGSFGFAKEVAAIYAAWSAKDRDAARAAVTDEMLDEMTVSGTPAECREQLERLRAAGADLPILFFPGDCTNAMVELAIDTLTQP